MSYVLLEVSYNGYSRSEVENELVSQDFYEKYKDEIDAVLSESWYPDFNGKHGHVDGDYSVRYLDSDEAKLMIINNEIEGFGRCYDCLMDELPDAVMKEFNDDIEKVSNGVVSFNLSIDLSLIPDIEAEKSKIRNLLEKSGYIILK